MQDCASTFVGAIKIQDTNIVGSIIPEKRQTLLQDILSGRMRLPLENKKAMVYLQHRDQDLKRVRSLLQAGQLPNLKRDDHKVKIFFRADVATSIDGDGCLVVTKMNRKDLVKRKLVVLPNDLSLGLLYSLHLNLNHPTATQLVQVVDTRFFIQDVHNKCIAITEACTPCMSLKEIPAEVQHFKSNEPPQHPGLAFTVDVIKTNKQLVFVSVDNFSGLVAATLIKSEVMEELRDGIIKTVVPFMASSLGRVRVDPAPGFTKLSTTSGLSDLGIELEIGNPKNKNKVALVDTKIKELRKAMLKAAPAHNVVNIRVLAKACTAVNETIRQHNLSAKEIHFSRDSATNKNLDLNDDELRAKIQDKREKVNQTRAKHQESLRLQPKPAGAGPGQVVFLKQEGDKTKPRDLYLVINTDRLANTMTICKIRDALTEKPMSIEPQRYLYNVHQNDAFLARGPLIVSMRVYNTRASLRESGIFIQISLLINLISINL